MWPVLASFLVSACCYWEHYDVPYMGFRGLILVASYLHHRCWSLHQDQMRHQACLLTPLSAMLDRQTVLTDRLFHLIDVEFTF
jgi:hypothetical protein